MHCPCWWQHFNDRGQCQHLLLATSQLLSLTQACHLCNGAALKVASSHLAEICTWSPEGMRGESLTWPTCQKPAAAARPGTAWQPNPPGSPAPQPAPRYHLTRPESSAAAAATGAPAPAPLVAARLLAAASSVQSPCRGGANRIAQRTARHRSELWACSAIRSPPDAAPLPD